MVKNLPVNAGDVKDQGSIPGSGRSPGGGHGNPFQYSCLGNPMDRGTWWYGVDDKKVKERKRLIFPALCRGPIKPLTQDLLLSRSHQMPSRGGLRSPGRKVSTTGFHTPESQPEKKTERERERDKKRPGDLSSDGAKVL